MVSPITAYQLNRQKAFGLSWRLALAAEQGMAADKRLPAGRQLGTSLGLQWGCVVQIHVAGGVGFEQSLIF